MKKGYNCLECFNNIWKHIPWIKQYKSSLDLTLTPLVSSKPQSIVVPVLAQSDCCRIHCPFMDQKSSHYTQITHPLKHQAHVFIAFQMENNTTKSHQL